MRCQTIKERFPDFLTGELNRKDKQTVQDHLAECADCRMELEQLTEIWTKLDVLKEELPSPQVRSRFYSMLEEYKKMEEMPSLSFSERFGSRFQRLWPRRPVFQFALSCGLLVIGLLVGNLMHFTPINKGETTMLRREVTQMRQTLAVSLIDQASPSERLRGINLAYGMEAPNTKLIDSLLATLNTDPNINVRLAAADALYLFHNNPKVKEGLIQSLSQQSSPIVVASLIDVMVSIRERRAVESLKKLLEANDLEPDIKERIELGIKALSF